MIGLAAAIAANGSTASAAQARQVTAQPAPGAIPATSPSKAWIVGLRLSGPNSLATMILHWNGKAWS